MRLKIEHAKISAIYSKGNIFKLEVECRGWGRKNVRFLRMMMMMMMM